ncbi:YwqJ-related putative deaminase [Streptomyces phytohabitans]|uniref:YwqJ-related putative deaminase n=1 Tax=Streptomyces phytohabitans TaxID=1150371 RepID=UPI00345C0F92
MPDTHPAGPRPGAPFPSAAPGHAPLLDHAPDADPVDPTGTGAAGTPALRHRRDGILPAVAAVLSVRGTRLTCTGSKGDQPTELHPLVRDFLDTLGTDRSERHDGRCPEALLLSRLLATAEESRKGRAARKAFGHGDAKRALKHAKLTARHIREDGDPLHGGYAPPCRSCGPLLAHFGVRAVGPEEAR